MVRETIKVALVLDQVEAVWFQGQLVFWVCFGFGVLGFLGFFFNTF